MRVRERARSPSLEEGKIDYTHLRNRYHMISMQGYGENFPLAWKKSTAWNSLPARDILRTKEKWKVRSLMAECCNIACNTKNTSQHMVPCRVYGTAAATTTKAVGIMDLRKIFLLSLLINSPNTSSHAYGASFFAPLVCYSVCSMKWQSEREKKRESEKGQEKALPLQLLWGRKMPTLVEAREKLFSSPSGTKVTK